MGKFMYQDQPYGGSTNYASSVNCLDKDGNKSTVQAELDGLRDSVDEQNKNLGGLRFGVDGDGNYGYYGADGSLVPFKIPDANVVYVAWSNSKSYTYTPDWKHYKRLVLSVKHNGSACMAYVYEDGTNELLFTNWSSGANIFDVTFNSDGTIKISTTAGNCSALSIVPTN